MQAFGKTFFKFFSALYQAPAGLLVSDPEKCGKKEVGEKQPAAETTYNRKKHKIFCFLPYIAPAAGALKKVNYTFLDLYIIKLN